MTRKPASFGQLLREKRIAKGYSLRKFAKLADVSPTYLSQVEQENCDPPTVERVTKMAELLEENADEWIAWAGRMPDDLPEIIQGQPTLFPDLLRALNKLPPEELRTMVQEITQKMDRGKQKEDS